MSDERDFSYPVSDGVLHSADQWASRFLPDYYDPALAPQRLQTALSLLLDARLPPHAHVLDFGASVGVFVYWAANHRPAWRFQAVDADHSSIEVAERFFSAPNVVHRQVTHDGWRDLDGSSLDAITLLEVIEHVTDAGSMLDGFHGALRPGGMLLVSTPNAHGHEAIAEESRRIANKILRRRDDNGYAKLIDAAPYTPETHLGHIALHSVRTLSTMLKAHGFATESFALAPAPGGMLRRLLPDTIVLRAHRR